MTNDVDAREAQIANVRSRVDELVQAGDHAQAELALRDAISEFPGRLGLKLKLARTIEAQGRGAEASEFVLRIVNNRDDIPQWAAQTVAHFGYTITSGVKLDLTPEVITPFMAERLSSGAYERHECRLLGEVLRPGDVVLEVGGGIGFIGTYAMLTQPTATVVSYEANPTLMPVVHRTQELNGVSFEVRNAMLGRDEGFSDFFVNRAFWASSATHEYKGSTTIKVPVEPVADVMAEKPFNFIVMDIEGGEIELVPHMDLSNVDRFVLETHPNITGEKPIKQMLKQLKKEFGLRSKQEKGGVHLLVRRS